MAAAPARAIPRIRLQDIDITPGTSDGLSVNFQLDVTSVGGFLFSVRTLLPQLVSYLPNGTMPWSMPGYEDENIPTFVLGGSPATQAFERYVLQAAQPKGFAATYASTSELVGAVLPFFAVSLLAGFGLGWGTVVRRFRK